jgi:hypothetical protein
MWKLALGAGFVGALIFLYWQNIRAADTRGYDRCVAESREAVDAINRDVLGGNAEARRRLIELQGRLKVLSVDALTGVKNIPQCAESECALDRRFIDKLEEIRK